MGQQWAVREGDWKLIGNTQNPSVTLHNLADAKPEVTNHAKDRLGVVVRLRTLHDEWAKDAAQKWRLATRGWGWRMRLRMKPYILLSMTLACLAQGLTSWAVKMPAKWAFEPLREVAVPVGEGHPIDGFVRQRLAKAGLAQNETATPGALVRRLHFNLIGLPPEPEVIRSFEQNPTGKAYLKLVDELLASPLYGERWARHWLDVARYGESNGFEYNEPRRNAWPYRDWVINAFNADMPYYEFARMQLVGDVLRPGAEGAAAVGFLVAGMHNTVLPANVVLKQQARADELGEMMGVVGQSFLGLTIQCARCHDHKVDPISTEEYYSFAAAFTGVRHGERNIEGANPKKMFTARAGKPAVMRVHLRGNAGTLGDEVPPGAVSAVRGMRPDLKLTSATPDAERRRAMAGWISHRDNPLFNRVIVCLLYTSPSPRDATLARMPSSA